MAYLPKQGKMYLKHFYISDNSYSPSTCHRMIVKAWRVGSQTESRVCQRSIVCPEYEVYGEFVHNNIQITQGRSFAKRQQ